MNKAVFEIRSATENDSPPLFQLARAMATTFSVEKMAFEIALQEILNDSHMLLRVAVMNQDIVGYALTTLHPTFYANGRVAWVEELAVGSDRQRCGIGSALMRDSESWAQQHHCVLLAVATRRAEAFYHRIGYVKSATYFKKHLDDFL